MNPGQSVKDRAGRQMILEAEKRGELQPGGLVVEATAGNTGIGIAVVAQCPRLPHADRDPRDAEPGEEGHAAPAAAPSWSRCRRCPTPIPNNYQHVGRRMADELRKTRAERRALRRPVEQPRQPQGPLRLDRAGDLGADRRQGRRLHLLDRHRRHARRRLARTCARRRRTSSSASPTRAAPPCTTCSRAGEAKATRAARSPKASGSGRVDADHRRHRGRTRPISIPDEEAVPIIFDLLEHEGLCLGGSSGINVAGAIRLATGARAGPHHRDGARRLRHALPVEAVQSGVPALEGAAGAGVAGARERGKGGLGVDAGHPGRPKARSGMTSRVAPREGLG